MQEKELKDFQLFLKVVKMLKVQSLAIFETKIITRKRNDTLNNKKKHSRDIR